MDWTLENKTKFFGISGRDRETNIIKGRKTSIKRKLFKFVKWEA